MGTLVFWGVQNKVFLTNKKVVFLPVVVLAACVHWLFFLCCFCSWSCLFFQPIVLVFAFVQPIVLVFVVAIAQLSLIAFWGGGLVWFCFLLAFGFILLQISRNMSLQFQRFPLFSPTTPFFKIPSFDYFFPLSLWSFFMLFCLPSSSYDYSPSVCLRFFPCSSFIVSLSFVHCQFLFKQLFCFLVLANLSFLPLDFSCCFFLFCSGFACSCCWCCFENQVCFGGFLLFFCLFFFGGLRCNWP